MDGTEARVFSGRKATSKNPTWEEVKIKFVRIYRA
jgi:hypothetical protein